jgi:DNA-binding MarR family transcriptional regulator
MKVASIPLQRRTLGALLRLAEETLRDRVYGQMAQAGFPDIRPAHSALLRNLTEGGSRVSELAERAQMTKQSMGYLADSLAAAGYVALTPDPTDRRAKRVQLTDKGRAGSETMIRLSAEAEQAFAGMIGQADMARLRRILERLAEGLNEGVAV